MNFAKVTCVPPGLGKSIIQVTSVSTGIFTNVSLSDEYFIQDGTWVILLKVFVGAL